MSTLSLNSATDFYQRHESKFILVVVVLLSIYLIAFVAKLTWFFVPNTEQSANNSTANISQTQSGNNSSSQTNISQILGLNLFGDASSQPLSEQTQDVNDAPETTLNLVLSGVVASNQAGRGAAIIEYRNTQNTYSVGDKVEGTNVTLDEIFADRVIIKNRLSKETLMLDGIDFDEANAKRNQRITQQPMQTDSPRALVGPTNRPSPQVLREARQQLAQSPESFYEMISMSPHRIDGQLVGYRVTPGTKPGLFNSVGLLSGDIVTNLNGLDLTDLQQSLEALTELQEAESLELEILRSGEYISLDFDITDDSDI